MKPYRDSVLEDFYQKSWQQINRLLPKLLEVPVGQFTASELRIILREPTEGHIGPQLVEIAKRLGIE